MKHRKESTNHGFSDSDGEIRRRTFAAGLGVRLAASRHAARLTQAELAGRAGIHPWMMSRYERGVSLAPVDKLDLLADVLDVSLDYLAGRQSTGSAEAAPS